MQTKKKLRILRKTKISFNSNSNYPDWLFVCNMKCKYSHTAESYASKQFIRDFKLQKYIFDRLFSPFILSLSFSIQYYHHRHHMLLSIKLNFDATMCPTIFSIFSRNTISLREKIEKIVILCLVFCTYWIQFFHILISLFFFCSVSVIQH